MGAGGYSPPERGMKAPAECGPGVAVPLKDQACTRSGSGAVSTGHGCPSWHISEKDTPLNLISDKQFLKKYNHVPCDVWDILIPKNYSFSEIEIDLSTPTERLRCLSCLLLRLGLGTAGDRAGREEHGPKPEKDLEHRDLERAMASRSGWPPSALRPAANTP